MLKSEYTRGNLDFDGWLKLAADDPEKFEVLRKEYLGDYIAQVSTERRRTQLSCLQWRIDQERQMSANPMDACVRINGMMWDTFAGERGLAEKLHQMSYETAVDLPSAKIVPFKN